VKYEVERAKRGLEHLQIAPGRAAYVVSGLERAGEVIADPLVISVINFGKNRDTILHRIGFVMDAVQTIAEASSLSSPDSTIL